MPEPTVLVSLVIFAAMCVAAVVVLWRIGSVTGSLRQQTQFRRAASDVARRADTSLSELAAIVDEIRRRKLPPEAGQASLSASSEAIERYAEEAEGIEASGPQLFLRTGLVEDLERALRAIELIEHGRALLVTGGFERITEGETSVKRGYLNLLHSRESLRARVEELAREPAAPPPGLRGWWRRAH